MVVLMCDFVADKIAFLLFGDRFHLFEIYITIAVALNSSEVGILPQSGIDSQQTNVKLAASTVQYQILYTQIGISDTFHHVFFFVHFSSSLKQHTHTQIHGHRLQHIVCCVVHSTKITHSLQTRALPKHYQRKAASATATTEYPENRWIFSKSLINWCVRDFHLKNLC